MTILKELKLTVDSTNPLTLQKFLTEKGVSRRLLTKLKRQESGITCNGKLIRSIDTVCKDDVIILNIQDNSFLEPNYQLNVPIAFENENLIIFNKSGNMPVHPSIKHQGDTLGNFFSALYPDMTFRAINRLDKDTSGLVAVAKNAFSANLMQNSCKKVYYAVVHGITDISGTIDAPIARENESIIVRCVREDGQKAITHYKRIAYNQKYSLLEINLETGRTHQIRVHFSHIGHPLAGDDLYGGSRENINRQALHCGQMTFTEPLSSKTITIKSDFPDDMKKLMNGDLIMEKIASFQVDHTKFGVGMYISRIDDDIITYDIRMVRPNGGTYISNPSLHTIEHIFATYARNSEFSKNIIYVGPMGCRTGFYFITRGMSHENAIKLVRESYKYIADFEGEIMGCSAVECGNYLEHDLQSAKKDVLPLLEKLNNYTVEMLDYSWHYDKENDGLN